MAIAAHSPFRLNLDLQRDIKSKLDYFNNGTKLVEDPTIGDHGHKLLYESVKKKVATEEGFRLMFDGSLSTEFLVTLLKTATLLSVLAV